MYSLQKLKKYWFVNKWAVSFLYAVVFSVWVVNTTSISGVSKVLILTTNTLMVKGLAYISEVLVKKVYRPNFYQEGKMTLVDVIRRQTTSWGKFSEIYKSEDDYEKRKEFDIGIRSIWLTYLLTVIVVFITNAYVVLSTGNKNLFIVNWNRVTSVFFLITAYSLFLVFLEGWEFEKVRFGGANVKKLIRDYIILMIVLLSLAFWFATK